MDSQDHNTTATSAGHEGHGVHLCHRCGWPFPKPHPSAKHRRAHKRVCGTIEGYKIIHSEEHDHHLAVSDDEYASDEDEHTPSPNLVKKNEEGSGRVGEKSNKSEDDVFSDAVTDFSESGISPRLEERFESVKELDKNVEQKVVEGDPYGGGSLKVDSTAERIQQSSDPRSEVTSNPEPPANGNNESESIIPISDISAEAVSIGLINGSELEYSLGGGLQGQMKSAQDADIHVQEGKLTSVNVDSEEGEISDRTVTLESQEELCDKLIPEVDKHDLPSQTETLQNLGAAEGVNSAIHSGEISASIKTVEVARKDESQENRDATVEDKEVSHSTENIRSIEAFGENTSPEESLLSMPSVKPDESTQTSDATRHSDIASTVSSVDKEVEPKTSLAGGDSAGNFDASEGEKCNMIGDENWTLEPKDSFSVDTVLAPGPADNTFAREDDQTSRAFKKDVDHCEEKSESKLLETVNEKGEGASVKVLESKMPSDNSTDIPNSFAVNSEARYAEELSIKDSSTLESRNDDFEKSIQERGTGKVTGGLQSVSSSGLDAGLNHDTGDVLDRNSAPTASLEAQSPAISELPTNIHVTENVVGVESVDVNEIACESKDNNEVVASVATPKESISEDPTSLTDSELLSSNSANVNNCIREGAKTSESVDTAEVTAKLYHEDNVVLSREISESPTPRVQEAPTMSKCLSVTSPGVKESRPSEDSRTLKSVEIVSNEKLDDNILSSDKCGVTPSLKEPVPPHLDLHEASATGDDKTVTNVEDGTGVNSVSLQAEVDDKLTKQNDSVLAVDLSRSSSGRSDSLEGNCGSVVSDTLETNSQKHKTATDKSDTFEPPSFMTLVQSGDEGDQVRAATEIETVQNNQQPKSDSLQAGWFPSLTNVVNESEGRKKNEEIIAKVTNWSPVKQQHGPLKNLLSEVKSPNTKQVPAANQKVETQTKDNNAGVTTKDQENTNKDVEEWNSPARYPIEIKKEKKKGRSYWVPFVCCSSVHRDL